VLLKDNVAIVTFLALFRTGFRVRREQLCRTAREEAGSHGAG
jgi:hypothetical protein